MRWAHRIVYAAGLIWASPYTAVGLALALLAASRGARLRWVGGVLECGGGPLPRWAQALPRHRGIQAITFGHCVLTVDAAALDSLRAHERVHVRQYAIWGPLFGPAYLLESAWQALRGRDAYLANRFERQAYAHGGPFPLSPAVRRYTRAKRRASTTP